MGKAIVIDVKHCAKEIIFQGSVSIASDIIANSADNSDVISIKLNMCQIGGEIPG